MTVGDKIKEYRIEKGLTQAELASAVGLATITIQQYERGVRNPKPKQIEKLAGALGVTPFDLIGAAYWDENIDTERVSNEAATLDSVSKFFGKSPAKVLTDYLFLNATGQRKAADYIADLTEQPKYTK